VDEGGMSKVVATSAGLVAVGGDNRGGAV